MGYCKDSSQLTGHWKTDQGLWHGVTGKSLWTLQREELFNQNALLKEVMSSLSLEGFRQSLDSHLAGMA